MLESFGDGKISILPETLLHLKFMSVLCARTQLQSMVFKLWMCTSISPCAFVFILESLLLKVKWQLDSPKLRAKISE